MKVRNVDVACFAVLLLASACGKSDPVQDAVDATEALGHAADEAHGDCGKLAKGIDAVLDRYDMNAIKAGLMHQGPQTNGDDFEKKYGERMRAAIQKYEDAFEKCESDPQFKAVAAKLASKL